MCKSFLPSSPALALIVSLLGPWVSHSSCPADTAASLLPGIIPQELVWEARIEDGEIVPLAQRDTAWAALSAGQSQQYDCWYMHYGFTGSFTRSCDGNGPAADISGCLRTGCAWHRYILQQTIGPYLVTQGAEIEGIGSASYGSMVLASSGAFYAAPMSAAGILRVDTIGSATKVLAGPDLGLSTTKYSAIVQGPDGTVYAIPYSASQVLRIDPATDEVSAVGSIFEESFKWSHGVLAHDGHIYGIPSFASSVLRFNPATGDTSMLPGLVDSGIMKWLYGVVAPNGMVFGIPGNARAVLRIDPKLGEASSFGDFGTEARKWAHGLVGIDGQIYGVPSSATAVLRIDPVGSVASANLGQGLPNDDFKWSMGVAASDGKIYCIPRASQEVLRIDPLAGKIDLFGSLSNGKWKWQYGVLAPDGLIYAIPSSASHVLRINPSGSSAEEVGPDLGRTSQKYDAAALAPSGTIYAAPSSVSRVLQIGAEIDVCTRAPFGQTVTCTLGLACQVVLTSIAGRQSALNSANLLWISTAQGRCADKTFLAVKGVVNPQASSAEVGSGSWQFTIGTGIEGTPTFTHKLCWSPTSTSREIITLGSFELHGPKQTSIHCTLGFACTVAISGNGLSSGSAVSLMSIAGPCGSTAPVAIAGFTNPNSLNGTSIPSDSFIVHDLGTSQNGTTGVYFLCWSQASAGATSSGSEFLVYLGELTLVGPLLPENPIECFVGTICTISFMGTYLSTTNLLSVREDCDSGPQVGIAGIVSETSPGSDTKTYTLGTPSEGGRRVLVLCWQHSASAPHVLYGSFHVYGPMDGGIAVQCTLGKPCDLTIQDDFLYGASTILSMWNRLLVVAGAGSACPAEGVTLWSGASNPSRPLEKSGFYTLGTPNAVTYASSQAFIGDYTLCFSLDGQPNTFFMYIGSLNVKDVHCSVPETSHGVSPPCASADRNQQHVATLGNAESCAPLCAEFYSASELVLTCHYGRLEPPLYECRKKCLIAPSVTYGEDHSHCIDMPHGARCVLQCPAGTVKSGDLECTHGRWEHRPTLPNELLFDVPRCYRKCSAQEAGCATMGSGQLSHGDVCRAVCPRGFTPTISEVRCSDGIAEPRSFECSQNCVAPPEIAHSNDMTYCTDSADGARCFLRCEEGYVKSGDPICENGAWTVERCFAPCTGPSVVNAASLPCDGAPVIQHGQHCTPACQEQFSPVVQVGGESVVFDSSGPHLQCENGVLSPPSFACLATCMEKPNIEYADRDLLVNCQGTPHGSICSTPCLPGYIKTGDLECTNGVFGTAACLKECDDPPDIEFSTPNYACINKPPGAICVALCYEGFLPTGKSVCENGKWSSVQCLQVCRAPSDVKYSIWPTCAEGDRIQSGTICTHQCVEGFTPDIPQSLCIEGKLQPDRFQCQQFCGPPPDVPNVVDLSHCANHQVGEKCDFQCRTGFQPVGRWQCTVDGWLQHRGTILANGLRLRKSHSLGEIDTGREFQLSFEIELLSSAGQNYQSVLHFTATGKNCCELGDRVPAVLLSPNLEGRIGRELHVFMDPGPNCFLQDPLPRIGLRTQVVITFVGKVLTVTLDDKVACTASYSTEMEPQTGVTVWGSSPWYERADAELRDVVYDHMGVDRSKPKCEPVTCEDSPPPVPRATDDYLLDQSPCIGAAFNSVCQAINCPEGTRLQGKFLCGQEGMWIPEGGVAVECIAVLCPELLPFVSQTGVRTACNDRESGDLCVVTCAVGYSNSGVFTCGPDGHWKEVPGNPAACTALPCLEPPSIMNGAGREICNQLPSGMLCEAECYEGLKAVGEFKCDAQLWVDAPLCAGVSLLESANAQPNRAIVKGGFSAEPSSEIQAAMQTPHRWGTAVERAFATGMEKFLGSQLAEPATVAILASIGLDWGAGRRQLQETLPDDNEENTRPRGWRADLVYIIVPSSDSPADAQAIYAILAALSVDEIAQVMLQAMSPPLPESLNVRFSTPRLAELSAVLVAELATLLSEERDTSTKEQDITTAEPVFVIPTESNGTTLGPRPAIYINVVSEDEEDESSSSTSYKVLLYVSLSVGVCMGCLIFYRFLLYTRRHKEESDTVEKNDFDYAIEQFGDEHVSDGVDFQKIQKFQKHVAANDRLDHLRNVLQHSARGSDPGKAPSGVEREDPLAHWDIRHARAAPKPKAKAKMVSRSVKMMLTEEGDRAIEIYNRHNHKDRAHYPYVNYVRRSIYIMFCGRRIAKDIERKRAKREGRKSRFHEEETKITRKARLYQSVAHLPQDEALAKTLSKAGIPHFLIEALQQQHSEAGKDRNSTQVGEVPSMGYFNSEAFNSERSEGRSSGYGQSESSKSVALEPTSPTSPEQSASERSNSPKHKDNKDLEYGFQDSMISGKPSQGVGQVMSMTMSAARSILKKEEAREDAEAKYAPPVAEELGQGEQGVVLPDGSELPPHEFSPDDIQKMSPDEYDMYTENVIQDLFEFAGADNIAVKGNPIIPFWDPRTQAKLKAKGLKYNTTSSEPADGTKGGTVEKTNKEAKHDLARDVYVETRTTRYAKPTRRIFDEDYKKELEEKAKSARSQAQWSGISSEYSGSQLTGEEGEEEDEVEGRKIDYSEGVADKLETQDAISETSGELGPVPDAEFAEEDVDLEAAGKGSPTGSPSSSPRKNRKAFTGAGQEDLAEGAEGGRASEFVERKSNYDKYASSESMGEVKPPTNPKVIEAIEAAKKSNKYLSSNPEERATAAKTYMGISTGGGLGGWFGLNKTQTTAGGATTNLGAGFGRFFGFGEEAEKSPKGQKPKR